MIAIVPVVSLESCDILNFKSFRSILPETMKINSRALKTSFIADFDYLHWSIVYLNKTFYLPLLKDCRNPIVPQPAKQAPIGTLFIESKEFGAMYNQYSCDAKGINIQYALSYSQGLNFFMDQEGTFISVVTDKGIDEFVRYKYNSFKLGNLRSAFSPKHFCFSLHLERGKTTQGQGEMYDYSFVNYFDFSGIYLARISDRAMEIVTMKKRHEMRSLLYAVYSYWLELAKRNIEFYHRRIAVYVDIYTSAIYTLVMNAIDTLDINLFVKVLTDYFQVLKWNNRIAGDSLKVQEVSDRFNRFIGCFFMLNRYTERSFASAMNDSEEWRVFVEATIDYIIGESEGGAIERFAQVLASLDGYVSACYTPKLLKMTRHQNDEVKSVGQGEDIELIGNFLTRKLPESIRTLNVVRVFSAACIVFLTALITFK